MTKMKLYIKSKAEKRSYVEDKLEENTLVTLQHLAYLYIFPNSQDVKHWRTEVWKFFHRMSKVRIGRKVRYLTSEEFLNATYLQHNSKYTIEYVLESATELEPSQPVDLQRQENVSQFANLCEDYFLWLSIMISQEGEIKPTDCYNKLQSLGL